MKTTKLIIIITIGVFILGGLSLIPLSITTPTDNLEDTQQAQALKSSNTQIGFSTGTDDIVDFVGLDQAYRCEFSYQDEVTLTEGVTYVDGMRFRADFDTTIKELEINVDTHSIWDGSTVYSWSSVDPEGIKAPASADVLKMNPISQDENGDIIGYTCTETSVTDDMFELPEDIVFRDLTPEELE